MTQALTVEVLVRPEDRRRAMEQDVRDGLTCRDKTIPPVWFYDETGSRLFEEITRLPEYYLTRAERSILGERAAEIVERSRADTLIEIGSGTSEKTRLLLDAMASSGRLRSIVLLDISEEILTEAARDLGDRYGVAVRAVVGDLRRDLVHLGGDGRRLWAFLGSTIGNFRPAERSRLLSLFRRAMGRGDALLLGTDVVKPVERLLAAYDDSAGVTARFNLNVLRVLNRELGADFDPEGFSHRAVWNPTGRWIEMRLRSGEAQDARVEALGMDITLQTGEEILTEISAKFDPEALPQELRTAGLVPLCSWSDPAGDFLLTLAGALPDGADRVV